MGADQSTPRASGQPILVGTSKTCYYEVLGVDRLVGDDEIRKAYKKKALELHPDRNFNDTENATRRFAEVQTAYEILSDPQERAWYDSHRDAILGGDPDVSGGAPSEQPGSRYTSATTIFSLMGRFNSSVPMTDSSRGFFGILNAFFDQLAVEETTTCEWDGIISVEYPPFGKASDNYDAVAKLFYKTWSSFSTRKSFSWKDKYRLSDAPDRRVRRLMEKENKKFRDEGIREFNDAVLSLVTFVKKRDPRYIPNTQSEAERQQILRKSAAAQAARSRAAHQVKVAEYTVPEWARSRDDRERQEVDFSFSDEDSEVEHIECVVCNKTFKSENQFEAHEKSKKHIKAVQQLQRRMKKENAELDLYGNSTSQRGSERSEGVVDADVAVASPEATYTPDITEQRPQSVSKQEEELKQGATTSPTTEDDDEYTSRSAVADRLLSRLAHPTKSPKTQGDEAEETDSLTSSVGHLTLNEDGPGKKVGKAKLKREKKAARQAISTGDQDSHKCAVCSGSFTSRSKLFAHIKEYSHAALVPKAGVSKKQR
ncbi:hypothetical protein B0T26DRAFT_742371 [Lasiosphaeria miniovina]|uniref:Uncharacterized protein n=1 Tax=Lasiosphaeria miniovina TaxID=1954250 RepID=A0AA40ADK3_9PEZI|nr:uncharacterized protein B0T26DRAFT_742371 [Lasiosphaeria miniovina]KAK0713860.1 hypothetical protein B0T26DRAFT_742371 [Lasiosphaeria miniovina]